MSLREEISNLSDKERKKAALMMLRRGYSTVRSKGYNREEKQRTWECLDVIAHIRCGLQIAACTLGPSAQGGRRVTFSNEDDLELLRIVEVICSDHTINEVEFGPRVYLLKEIFHGYDYETLENLAKSFRWMLPQEPGPSVVS